MHSGPSRGRNFAAPLSLIFPHRGIAVRTDHVIEDEATLSLNRSTPKSARARALNKRKHVTLSFGKARLVQVLALQIVFVHRLAHLCQESKGIALAMRACSTLAEMPKHEFTHFSIMIYERSSP